MSIFHADVPEVLFCEDCDDTCDEQYDIVVSSFLVILGPARCDARDLVIANSDAALAAKAICPESLKRWRGAGHAVVSEEEPKSKHWLGKNIEDGIGNDFGVDANESATVSNTPDNWVDGPEDKGEARKSSEESLGFAVLVGSSRSAVVDNLVNNDKVGNASPCVPSPLLAITASVSSKETSQNHDDVSDNCNENVGTTESGQKGEIEQEEGSGNAPVDVSCPVDLSICNLFCVWKTVLVADGFDDLVEVDTITGGHSEIREEGKGGDEGSQDVEESLLCRHSEGQSVEC